VLVDNWSVRAYAVVILKSEDISIKLQASTYPKLPPPVTMCHKC